METINKIGQAMTRFYATKVGAKSWEEYILDKDMFDDGDTVTININDGTGVCRFGPKW